MDNETKAILIVPPVMSGSLLVMVLSLPFLIQDYTAYAQQVMLMDYQYGLILVAALFLLTLFLAVSVATWGKKYEKH